MSPSPSSWETRVDPELRARLQALLDEGWEIWDRFDNEVRQRHWHPFVAADYERVLQALLPLRAPGLRFLEWGSATGVITIMADLLGFEACGIELDPSLVRHARGPGGPTRLEGPLRRGQLPPRRVPLASHLRRRTRGHHRQRRLGLPRAGPSAGGLRSRLRLSLERRGADDARPHALLRAPRRPPRPSWGHRRDPGGGERPPPELKPEAPARGLPALPRGVSSLPRRRAGPLLGTDSRILARFRPTPLRRPACCAASVRACPRCAC